MLNESIIKIRCALQKKNLKKSGKNKFAGFDYFELADFLPTLNELMLAEGVNDLFTMRGELGATMMPDEKSPWMLDFNLTGFAGKKRGFSGGVSLMWMF